MGIKKQLGRNLTTDSVPGALLIFAAPLFLSNLLQAVYRMVVTGRYLGILGQSTVMGLLNTPPEAWNHTKACIDICQMGLIFICGYSMVGAVLRSGGTPGTPSCSSPWLPSSTWCWIWSLWVP